MKGIEAIAVKLVGLWQDRWRGMRGLFSCISHQNGQFVVLPSLDPLGVRQVDANYAFKCEQQKTGMLATCAIYHHGDRGYDK